MPTPRPGPPCSPRPRDARCGPTTPARRRRPTTGCHWRQELEETPVRAHPGRVGHRDRAAARRGRHAGGDRPAPAPPRLGPLQPAPAAERRPQAGAGRAGRPGALGGPGRGRSRRALVGVGGGRARRPASRRGGGPPAGGARSGARHAEGAGGARGGAPARAWRCPAGARAALVAVLGEGGLRDDRAARDRARRRPRLPGPGPPALGRGAELPGRGGRAAVGGPGAGRARGLRARARGRGALWRRHQRGGRGGAAAGGLRRRGVARPAFAQPDRGRGPGLAPGHLRGRDARAPARGRAGRPGTDPGALPPILRVLHRRRLGGHPLRRSGLHGLRPHRRAGGGRPSDLPGGGAGHAAVPGLRRRARPGGARGGLRGRAGSDRRGDPAGAPGARGPPLRGLVVPHLRRGRGRIPGDGAGGRGPGHRAPLRRGGDAHVHGARVLRQPHASGWAGPTCAPAATRAAASRSSGSRAGPTTWSGAGCAPARS